MAWGFCQSAIVPAPRFNDLIDKWDSKSAVLSVAVTQLMQQCLAAHRLPEPMRFVIDKHGGRNTYSALLQHAFADGIVLAEEEGRLRSVYRVEGLDRPVRIVVTPKADVENFTVALASMISKYVRELSDARIQPLLANARPATEADRRLSATTRCAISKRSGRRW